MSAIFKGTLLSEIRSICLPANTFTEYTAQLK